MDQRVPPETEKVFDQLASAGDNKTALKLLAHLLDDCIIYENYEPIKFDPDTGEPVEHEWVPKHHYREYGCVEIVLRKAYERENSKGLVAPRDSNMSIPLPDDLVTKIVKEGPLILSTETNKYIAIYNHHTDSSSYGSRVDKIIFTRATEV